MSATNPLNSTIHHVNSVRYAPLPVAAAAPLTANHVQPTANLTNTASVYAAGHVTPQRATLINREKTTKDRYVATLLNFENLKRRNAIVLDKKPYILNPTGCKKGQYNSIEFTFLEIITYLINGFNAVGLLKENPWLVGSATNRILDGTYNSDLDTCFYLQKNTVIDPTNLKKIELDPLKYAWTLMREFIRTKIGNISDSAIDDHFLCKHTRKPGFCWFSFAGIDFKFILDPHRLSIGTVDGMHISIISIESLICCADGNEWCDTETKFKVAMDDVKHRVLKLKNPASLIDICWRISHSKTLGRKIIVSEDKYTIAQWSEFALTQLIDSFPLADQKKLLLFKEKQWTQLDNHYRDCSLGRMIYLINMLSFLLESANQDNDKLKDFRNKYIYLLIDNWEKNNSQLDADKSTALMRDFIKLAKSDINLMGDLINIIHGLYWLKHVFSNKFQAYSFSFSESPETPRLHIRMHSKEGREIFLALKGSPVYVAHQLLCSWAKLEKHYKGTDEEGLFKKLAISFALHFEDSRLHFTDIDSSSRKTVTNALLTAFLEKPISTILSIQYKNQPNESSTKFYDLVEKTLPQDLDKDLFTQCCLRDHINDIISKLGQNDKLLKDILKAMQSFLGNIAKPFNSTDITSLNKLVEGLYKFQNEKRIHELLKLPRLPNIIQAVIPLFISKFSTINTLNLEVRMQVLSLLFLTDDHRLYIPKSNQETEFVHKTIDACFSFERPPEFMIATQHYVYNSWQANPQSKLWMDYWNLARPKLCVEALKSAQSYLKKPVNEQSLQTISHCLTIACILPIASTVLPEVIYTTLQFLKYSDNNLNLAIQSALIKNLLNILNEVKELSEEYVEPFYKMAKNALMLYAKCDGPIDCALYKEQLELMMLISNKSTIMGRHTQIRANLFLHMQMMLASTIPSEHLKQCFSIWLGVITSLDNFKLLWSKESETLSTILSSDFSQSLKDIVLAMKSMEKSIKTSALEKINESAFPLTLEKWLSYNNIKNIADIELFSMLCMYDSRPEHAIDQHKLRALLDLLNKRNKSSLENATDRMLSEKSVPLLMDIIVHCSKKPSANFESLVAVQKLYVTIVEQGLLPYSQQNLALEMILEGTNLALPFSSTLLVNTHEFILDCFQIDSIVSAMKSALKNTKSLVFKNALKVCENVANDLSNDTIENEASQCLYLALKYSFDIQNVEKYKNSFHKLLTHSLSVKDPFSYRLSSELALLIMQQQVPLDKQHSDNILKLAKALIHLPADYPQKIHESSYYRGLGLTLMTSLANSVSGQHLQMETYAVLMDSLLKSLIEPDSIQSKEECIVAYRDALSVIKFTDTATQHAISEFLTLDLSKPLSSTLQNILIGICKVDATFAVRLAKVLNLKSLMTKEHYAVIEFTFFDYIASEKHLKMCFSAYHSLLPNESHFKDGTWSSRLNLIFKFLKKAAINPKLSKEKLAKLVHSLTEVCKHTKKQPLEWKMQASSEISEILCTVVYKLIEKFPDPVKTHAEKLLTVAHDCMLVSKLVDVPISHSNPNNTLISDVLLHPNAKPITLDDINAFERTFLDADFQSDLSDGSNLINGCHLIRKCLITTDVNLHLKSFDLFNRLRKLKVENFWVQTYSLLMNLFSLQPFPDNENDIFREPIMQLLDLFSNKSVYQNEHFIGTSGTFLYTIASSDRILFNVRLRQKLLSIPTINDSFITILETLLNHQFHSKQSLEDEWKITNKIENDILHSNHDASIKAKAFFILFNHFDGILERTPAEQIHYFYEMIEAKWKKYSSFLFENRMDDQFLELQKMLVNICMNGKKLFSMEVACRSFAKINFNRPDVKTLISILKHFCLLKSCPEKSAEILLILINQWIPNYFLKNDNDETDRDFSLLYINLCDTQNPQLIRISVSILLNHMQARCSKMPSDYFLNLLERPCIKSWKYCLLLSDAKNMKELDESLDKLLKWVPSHPIKSNIGKSIITTLKKLNDESFDGENSKNLLNRLELVYLFAQHIKNEGQIREFLIPLFEKLTRTNPSMHPKMLVHIELAKKFGIFPKQIQGSGIAGSNDNSVAKYSLLLAEATYIHALCEDASVVNLEKVYKRLHELFNIINFENKDEVGILLEAASHLFAKCMILDLKEVPATNNHLKNFLDWVRDHIFSRTYTSKILDEVLSYSSKLFRQIIIFPRVLEQTFNVLPSSTEGKPSTLLQKTSYCQQILEKQNINRIYTLLIKKKWSQHGYENEFQIEKIVRIIAGITSQEEKNRLIPEENKKLIVFENQKSITYIERVLFCIDTLLKSPMMQNRNPHLLAILVETEQFINLHYPDYNKYYMNAIYSYVAKTNADLFKLWKESKRLISLVVSKK